MPTGLNVLIASHQAVAEAGGWLRLAALTESVRRVVELVGVDAFIDCRESLRQALSI
ncbi:STAS domain-containing protein [Streptomyces collinus]|uniref:STAS domain-containing protein n=1 Tax=Streptomyces collinus TaxID=42684 RepID=UPI003325A590